MSVLPKPPWEMFVKHAPYVLHNPLFEQKERDRQLEIARRGLALLEAARGEAALLPALDALDQALSNPEWSYQLVRPAVRQWARTWVASDEPSLRRALRCFLGSAETPEERFREFVKATEETQAAGLTLTKPGRLMSFGSLFNFALAPETSPVVGLNAFTAQLKQLKGFEPKPAPLAEQYREYLDFARRLQGEMREAGIEVRDMLDVQSLVSLSSVWLAPWSGGLTLWDFPGDATPALVNAKPPSARPVPRGVPYLAVCCCLGYEAPYLAEWIEFHRLVGVERFILYNNGDREGQREVLAPYVEKGIALVQDWPLFPPQTPAYNHCLQQHRNDARWIAFLDADEFLFSPTATSLPEVLAEYEGWPGVGVGRVAFGPSGHRTKPDGLVIESYVQTIGPKLHRGGIKSIVDPARTAECYGPHRFGYVDGQLAVDENHYPILGGVLTFDSVARLRINHYYTRSEAEFREKLLRPRAYNAELRPENLRDQLAEFEDRYGRHDDAILPYVPRVREALAASSARLVGSDTS